MKLIGTSRLSDLANRAGESLDGAVPALLAELEAGSWSSMKEIAEFYPFATVDGFKVRILLDGGFRIDFVADFASQMILIEYAGAAGGARASKVGSKVA